MARPSKTANCSTASGPNEIGFDFLPLELPAAAAPPVPTSPRNVVAGSGLEFDRSAAGLDPRRHRHPSGSAAQERLEWHGGDDSAAGRRGQDLARWRRDLLCLSRLPGADVGPHLADDRRLLALRGLDRIDRRARARGQSPAGRTRKAASRVPAPPIPRRPLRSATPQPRRSHSHLRPPRAEPSPSTRPAATRSAAVSRALHPLRRPPPSPRASRAAPPIPAAAPRRRSAAPRGPAADSSAAQIVAQAALLHRYAGLADQHADSPGRVDVAGDPDVAEGRSRRRSVHPAQCQHRLEPRRGAATP